MLLKYLVIEFILKKRGFNLKNKKTKAFFSTVQQIKKIEKHGI